MQNQTYNQTTCLKRKLKQKYSFRSNQINSLVLKTSFGFLGLMTLIMLCPLVPNKADATDCQPGDPAPCTTKSAESYVDVEIIPAISLALQNRLDIEVIPKADGATQVGSATLRVATNHPDGYTIFMAAGKLDHEGKASLVNDAANAKINPIPTSSATLPMNTWGYKLTQTAVETPDALYQAVPADTTMIKQVDTTSYADKFSLDFGVAVNTSLPAGFYGNSVILSVVANPRIVRTLSDLHYMQDMTSTVCAQTPGVEQDEKYKLDPVTKQLVDTRDGKKYWVAKLADGNCWMTQNLALDLSTSKALTLGDSDVTASWKPAYSTSTKNDYSTGGQYDIAYSWNVGEYVLAIPLYKQGCKNLAPGTSLSVCTEFQLVDDSWSYTAAKEGVWNDYSGLVAVDKGNKTYDSHYLVGNYYQFTAANAGTTNATASICPKGWKLPTASHDSTGLAYDQKGSFASLFAAYGYPKPGVSTGWSGLGSGGNGGYYAFDYPGATSINKAPLYFVVNGGIDPSPSVNSFNGVGRTGYSWSSSSTAGSAHYLYFNSTQIAPTNLHSARYGFSVRCVAR